MNYNENSDTNNSDRDNHITAYMGIWTIYPCVLSMT